MFCFHKWTHDDGYKYQTCTKCGYTKPIEQYRVPCNHVWKKIAEGKTMYGSYQTGSWYDLQCEMCGDIERRSV